MMSFWAECRNGTDRLRSQCTHIPLFPTFCSKLLRALIKQYAGQGHHPHSVTALLVFDVLALRYFARTGFLRNAGVEPHTLSEVIVYATVVSGF